MINNTIRQARRKLNIDLRKGILGNDAGEVHTSASDSYYVRIEKAPGIYYAPTIMPIRAGAVIDPGAGIPVLIGYDTATRRDVIIGMDIVALGQIGISPLHSNPNDQSAADLVPVERFAPLYSRPHPNSTLNPFVAQVYPCNLADGDSITTFAGASINLVSYLPSTGNHRYVMVFLKSDFATLEAFGSVAQAYASNLSDADLTEAFMQRTADSIPVRAYVIRADDTSLNGSISDSPFLRQFVSDTATHSQYLLRQPYADWIINDNGGNFDGRIEGDTDQYLTVWDAGADKVGIGTATMDSGAKLTIAGFTRATTAIYRRYYHIALGSANPGASGPTWVDAGANTTGGWRLTNAAWLLRGQADIHADWDGASDLNIGVNFMVNVDNAGGGAGDTVDLKATIYYKGIGDTVTKSQIVEVATIVGQSAQYKQFRAEFTIDYDAASNVVEVGDVIAIVINLETDTSEVDDIVITSMEFSYNTRHIGIESGDI